MRIYKTKLYKVIYKSTGGNDTFSGKYLLENEWINKLLTSGEATAITRG